jgi:hypothetical protein
MTTPKLTPAQIHALGQCYSGGVPEWMPSMRMVRATTLRRLEQRGLVSVRGSTRGGLTWVLTPAGRAVVKQLLGDGRLTKE